MWYATVLLIFLEMSVCQSSHSIIWHSSRAKHSATFESMSYDVGIMNKHSAEERYDLKGEDINFIYFEDEDFFEFRNDDNKATGSVGDLYQILQEYLNFTMITKETNNTLMGFPNDDGSWTGLIGMVQRKEYAGIPYGEIFRTRYDAVDFTIPFLADRHQLFIESSHRFKKTWMIDIFSRNIWYFVIILYTVSITLSIVMHSVFSGHSSPAVIRDLALNYLFYYFCALCGQGDELYRILENQKMMAFSIGMFSRFLLLSYSSYIYVFMTRTEPVKPFQDLETLFYDTDYKILMKENAGPYNNFKAADDPIIRQINRTNRYKVFPSYNGMWDATCSDTGNVAFQYFYDSKMHNISCGIEAIGKSYHKSLHGVILSKNSTYRKPLNYGIMKLRESGIMEYIKKKWFRMRYVEKRIGQYSVISLNTVFLPIYVYTLGISISIFVFILENYWMRMVPDEFQT